MATRNTRRVAPSMIGIFVASTALLQGGVGFAFAAGHGDRTDASGVAAKPPPARFASAATADVGGVFPGGVAVADFTSDGRPDVAVALTSFQPGPGVVVLRGDGHGGFAQRVDTNLPGGARACDLATGDLNGDGNADLAVSACGSGAAPVFLLTGNGDGTFAVSQQIPIDSFALHHPAIGELNGDGVADVAVVRESGGLSVYFGKGDGRVGKPTEYPAMSSDSIRAIDVTGDGKTDLSFTGPSTMVNQGGGVFGSPVGPDFFAVGSTVVDLDGDGIPDGAGVDASGAHVFIGHGTGDGRYHLTQTISVPVSQTLSIAGGDFTGDGKADLVVNGDGNLVYLLAGRGDGSVRSPIGFSTGTGHLTAADFGGSAARDLISETQDPGTVYGALGGQGGLAAAALVPSKVPGEIALGDLNGDGRMDVATAGGVLPQAGPMESDLGIDLNRGHGRFASTKVFRLREESSGSGVAALRLVDVNGDGDLEAVGGFENFQFNPNNLFVALGQGNGRFSSPLLTSTGEASADALDVAVADVTGDGKPDIVSNTNSSLSVLPGKGNGTFRAPVLSGRAGPETTHILLGDVTGDGVTDAVVTIVTGGEDFSSSDLVLERGDQEGHFTEVQSISVDTNILGAVLVDLNDDGRLDLAADGRGGTDGGRGGLHVLLSTVGGSLGSPVFYPVGAGDLAAADLNLDGTTDVAIDGQHDITLIGLNHGNGTLVFGSRVITPSGPAAVGDITGEGAPDLFAHPSARDASFGFTRNLRRP